MPCVPTEYLYQQVLINAKAATPTPGLAGVLTGSKMGLYTTNVGLSSAMVLADLTPAAYAGYALQLCAFGSPYRRASGGIAVSSAFLEFFMTDALLPTLVYGYFIVDSAGTHLLIAESFGSDGIGLVDTLSAINVSAEFCLGGVDPGVMSLNF